MRERQTARGYPTTPTAETVHRLSAARSYLVLVGSAELALHSPARLEVAREAPTTPEEAKTEEAARTECLRRSATP